MLNMNAVNTLFESLCDMGRNPTLYIFKIRKFTPVFAIYTTSPSLSSIIKRFALELFELCRIIKIDNGSKNT
jgi:hypothetical protein